MNDPAGIDSVVQNLLIYACGPVLNNPLQPFMDPDGNLLQVPMVAEFPDQNLESPIVVVGVETGRESMPSGFGKMNLSTDRTKWEYMAYAEDCRAVFTIYTTSDFMRRYLADALKWGIRTAYAVGSDGLLLQQYVLNWLCNRGIFPTPRPLFESVNFDPVSYTAPRPTGLPFLAQVRMNYTLQLAYSLPVAAPVTGNLVITPRVIAPGVPGNATTPTPVTGQPTSAPVFLPITIPIPPVFFPGP